jgi:hypothetical protein
MEKPYLVTRQVIKSIKEPNIELGCLWNGTFYVSVKDGYNKYVARELEYTFPSALETIRQLVLLGMPTEEISVHGSVTYTSQDILDFLSVPKYNELEELHFISKQEGKQ